jgi:hypothetical protein
VDILVIGGNPVRCDLTLARVEGELPRTHQPVQRIF